MRISIASILTLAATTWSAGQDVLELTQRIPFFTQRLNCARWEVRYCLLGELTGRDSETKQTLEILIHDKNRMIANQALVRYLHNFVNVDPRLFDPTLLLPQRISKTDLTEDQSKQALVDYSLVEIESLLSITT